MFYHFQHKAKYWWKIAIFIPLAFDAPRWGSPSEYCRTDNLVRKHYNGVTTRR